MRELKVWTYFKTTLCSFWLIFLILLFSFFFLDFVWGGFRPYQGLKQFKICPNTYVPNKKKSKKITKSRQLIKITTMQFQNRLKLLRYWGGITLNLLNLPHPNSSKVCLHKYFGYAPGPLIRLKFPNVHVRTSQLNKYWLIWHETKSDGEFRISTCEKLAQVSPSGLCVTSCHHLQACFS